MSSVLAQNHFEIFSLPQSYALDRALLDARYRELQRVFHPDRFASAGDHERRVSIQQAAQINEAYQVLKDPLRRGQYLLELRGKVINDEQDTHQDPEFLMQQIELREALGEVRGRPDPLAVLEILATDIRTQYAELQAALELALDAGDDAAGEALVLVRRMQFFTRLQEEVQALEADLEDELF